MGTSNKEKVQLVISHLEGCSGNFLGRLFAARDHELQARFRVDIDTHPQVLAINGVTDWDPWIAKLQNHTVIVTHCYDRDLIKNTCPNAQTLALYPYTHIGNVLYNICFKKLTNKIPNLIDNFYLHIKEWHRHLITRQPAYDCYDFWDLTDISNLETWFGRELNQQQILFFNNYWKQQMMLPLNLPLIPATVPELLEQWQCYNNFNHWMVAWTIYVYELINGLEESQRAWSINTQRFNNWNDVIEIQSKYNHTPYEIANYTS